MYSASVIVNLICQVLNIPGRTTQVGQMLNIILANYAQTIDEDTIRKTVVAGTGAWPVNIGPNVTIPYFYALPTDYLRFYDCFYNVLGVVYQLKQIDVADFDGLYTAQGIQNYPEWFVTDVGGSNPRDGNPVQFAVYPPPAVPIVPTLRYRPQTGDIATPETSNVIPWFPNQKTLFFDLGHMASYLANDERGLEFRNDAEKCLGKYLVISDDKEGYAQRVQLDPRSFRNNLNLPPSKLLGF